MTSCVAKDAMWKRVPECVRNWGLKVGSLSCVTVCWGGLIAHRLTDIEPCLSKRPQHL